MDEGKEITKHIQQASVPMLKHICEEKGINIVGSSKSQVTLSILTFIGEDSTREAEIREFVDHLLREKVNRAKEAKKKKIVVQAEIHDNSGGSKGEMDDSNHSSITLTNSVANQGGESIPNLVSSSGEDLVGCDGVENCDNGENDPMETLTQPLFSQESGPSDTFTIPEGEELRPKSTSTDLNESGMHEDTDINDQAVNDALTGNHSLNSSVFQGTFMDESQFGTSPSSSKPKRKVRFSEQDHSEGKLDLVVTMLVEMRGAFEERMDKVEDQMQRIYEAKKTDNEQAAKKIHALERNMAALSELNSKAMDQVNTLLKEKSNATELAKQQASKALEMAEELKKERAARQGEQSAHLKELKEIRLSLSGATIQAQPQGGHVQQDRRTNQDEHNRAPKKGATSTSPPSSDNHKQTDKGTSRKDGVVLIVGDSNLDSIVPGRLHDSKQVRKLKRTTMKEAEENIAWAPHDKVTDVILHIGAEDMRKGTNATEVKEGIRRVLTKYKENFKKARVHLSALPPSESKQEANWHLRELAQETKSNFISLKEMKDRRTKGLIAGMTQGNRDVITPKGAKVLAAGMKRSLYSKANLDDTHDEGRADNLLKASLDAISKKVAEILSQGET